MPTVVTVTNEFGEARYPTLMGIMSASRKAPLMLDSSAIGFGPLQHSIQLNRLFLPTRADKCEMILGENLAGAAESLALRLRDENII